MTVNLTWLRRPGQNSKPATIRFRTEVSHVPKFHRFMVSEKGNGRRGFVEEPEYRKLAEKAKEPWLRALLTLAYTYGFGKGELLEMRCSQVDLLNNTVCLYSGETKNKEGRTVALTEECRVLVTEMRKGKQPDDYLLTRENGEPVRDLRGTWDALTKAARASRFAASRLPALRRAEHDSARHRRASCDANLRPQDAQRFYRYNIISEADLADAARKIEAGARNSQLLHSEAESQSDERRQKPEKPIQSVS